MTRWLRDSKSWCRMKLPSHTDTQPLPYASSLKAKVGFTTVQGKCLRMQRGDLVLTPPWHCRDQGKGGSGAMVWLDGLDVPNYTLMPAHFVEYYPSPAYPYEEVDSKSSPLVFPWAAVQTKLDENEGDWSSEDYTKPDGTSGMRIEVKFSPSCFPNIFGSITNSWWRCWASERRLHIACHSWNCLIDISRILGQRVHRDKWTALSLEARRYILYTRME